MSTELPKRGNILVQQTGVIRTFVKAPLNANISYQTIWLSNTTEHISLCAFNLKFYLSKGSQRLLRVVQGYPILPSAFMQFCMLAKSKNAVSSFP